MMELVLNLGMAILCDACGEPYSEHATGCPRGRIIEVMDTQALSVRCPLCRKAMEINADDFFECRGCHTQFCGGYAGGVDPESPDATLHFIFGGRGQDFDHFDGQRVVQLPCKGKGIFKIDRIVKALEEVEKEWKARRA